MSYMSDRIVFFYKYDAVANHLGSRMNNIRPGTGISIDISIMYQDEERFYILNEFTITL